MSADLWFIAGIYPVLFYLEKGSLISTILSLEITLGMACALLQPAAPRNKEAQK